MKLNFGSLSNDKNNDNPTTFVCEYSVQSIMVACLFGTFCQLFFLIAVDVGRSYTILKQYFKAGKASDKAKALQLNKL